jgi:hypothetical protein
MSPSCPVLPVHVIGLPTASQHCVCPVCGTRARWAKAGVTKAHTPATIRATINTASSLDMCFDISPLLSATDTPIQRHAQGSLIIANRPWELQNFPAQVPFTRTGEEWGHQSHRPSNRLAAMRV